MNGLQARVGPEQWRKNIVHVRENVEDHFWVADSLQEEHVEEFIISIGGDDFDSSTEKEEEGSSFDDCISDSD